MTLKEEAVLVCGIEDKTAELLIADNRACLPSTAAPFLPFAAAPFLPSAAAPCPTFAAVPRLPSGASIPT
jgi:hypothetical protein